MSLPNMQRPSPITTFFSGKGGVGRSLALSNAAVQLARYGYRVLVVDFDLEAPGLDQYLTSKTATEEAGIVVTLPDDDSGLLGALDEGYSGTVNSHIDTKWRNRVVELKVPPLKKSYRRLGQLPPGDLHFLPSGYGNRHYRERLARLDWERFFKERNGGEWLELTRQQWIDSYDYVLVDARTGLTDSGGVCTIQLPDLLVFVFTANEQSIDGIVQVAEWVKEARSRFAFDRGALAILPLLSRWDGESEVDLADKWLDKISNAIAGVTGNWLPRQFTSRDFLEKIRIPYTARFSFGEPIPVLTHSLSDPVLPAYGFDLLAQIIESNLHCVGGLIDPHYKSSEEIETAEAEAISDSDELKLHKELLRRAVRTANSANDKTREWVDYGEKIVQFDEHKRNDSAIREAVSSIQALMKKFSKEIAPFESARAHRLIGLALYTLSERSAGVDQLTMAVAEMEKSWDIFSDVRAPLESGATSFHLGNIFLRLGDRTDGVRSFRQAESEFNKALNIFTKEIFPDRWISCQASLSAALSRIGEREEKLDYLHKAMDICKLTLAMVPRAKTHQRAALTHNMGTISFLIGKIKENARYLDLAIKSYKSVLRVCSKNNEPLDWAMAQNDIGEVLFLQAKSRNDPKLANNAVRYFKRALSIRTIERAPLKCAETHANIAESMRYLGNARANLSALKEAMLSAESAVSIFGNKSEMFSMAEKVRAMLNTIEMDIQRLEAGRT